jgi:hypothetical protein
MSERYISFAQRSKADAFLFYFILFFFLLQEGKLNSLQVTVRIMQTFSSRAKAIQVAKQ